MRDLYAGWSEKHLSDHLFHLEQLAEDVVIDGNETKLEEADIQTVIKEVRQRLKEAQRDRQAT